MRNTFFFFFQPRVSLNSKCKIRAVNGRSTLSLGKGVAKRVTDTLQPQRDCATVRLPAAVSAPGGGASGGAGGAFGIGEEGSTASFFLFF